MDLWVKWNFLGSYWFYRILWGKIKLLKLYESEVWINFKMWVYSICKIFYGLSEMKLKMIEVF